MLVVNVLGGGALPADAVVHVSSGAGTEDFPLANPGPTETIFCGVVPLGASVDGGVLDAGPSEDPSDVGSIVCQLWTDGAADVEVDASGLASAIVTLEATMDNCGLVTSDHTLTLHPPPLDAGM